MRKTFLGIWILLTKIGFKLFSVLIKMVKALKVGKIGLATGSAASYAYLMSWEFALVIMVSLFFHEYGHIWAMKRCGMKTRGMYFIPFIGAAAVPDEMFPSRKAEVYIAMMGPVWGLFLSMITAFVYLISHNAFFGAVAGFMATINLFNLLPINPLDGGRVFKSIAFSIHSKVGVLFLIFGFIFCVYLSYATGLVLFLILLIVGALELLGERTRLKRNKEKEENLSLTLELNEKIKRRNEEIESLPTLTREIKDVLKWELLPIPKVEKIKELEKMSPFESFLSFVNYVGLACALFILLVLVESIPEVKIASDILKS